MRTFGNCYRLTSCPNMNRSVRQDNFEEFVARAERVSQRWQEENDDCASFDLFAAAYAVAAAEEKQKDFDLFAACAAAEADSGYVADLDGLVAAVEVTSERWEEELRQADAVDLLTPTEDEANLGFKFGLLRAA